MAERWYNTSYHIAIWQTPFEALYGTPPPPHIPRDSSIEAMDGQCTKGEAIITDLQNQLQGVQNIKKTQADKKMTNGTLAKGD